MTAIKLLGKRGQYLLVYEGVVLHRGSNRERLRGVQYFLEANPATLDACVVEARQKGKPI